MFCRMTRDRPVRELAHVRELREVVGHQDHVAGLDRDVRAGCPHGDADVRDGHGRGIVDPVADHGHRAVLLLELPDRLDLVRRQKLRPVLVDPDAARDGGAPNARCPRSASRSGRPARDSRCRASTAPARTSSAIAMRPVGRPPRLTRITVLPSPSSRATASSALPVSTPCSEQGAGAADPRRPAVERGRDPAPGRLLEVLGRSPRRRSCSPGPS